MAEFQDVMRQWQRLCESCKGCGACPLAQADVEGIYMCENGITAFNYEAAEPLILDWAAAHPEPVYPTWWNWFAAGGLDPDDPIPADIAQKLGLQPKEG